MEASEVTAVQDYDPSQLRELLQVYYTWLFPYDRYFQWLQYGTDVWAGRIGRRGKRRKLARGVS